MSAFSNQDLPLIWFCHSYSALPTSNFYSWNLSSWGKTTQQQSYVSTESTPCLGTNWGAADTAQNNNPISPKTSYSVVPCLLSVQMNCSIYLPVRERCDTSNRLKQSSCSASDTKKCNQSFLAVWRHRLQLCTSWNNSRISQPITVFESALLFPICI